MMFFRKKFKFSKINEKKIDALQYRLGVICISTLWKLTVFAVIMSLLDMLPKAARNLVVIDNLDSIISDSFSNLINSVRFVYNPGLTVLGVLLILITVVLIILLYLGTNWLLVKFIELVMIKGMGLDRDRLNEEYLKEKPIIHEPLKIIKDNTINALKGIVMTNWFHYLILAYLYKFLFNSSGKIAGVIGVIVLAFVFFTIRIIIWYKKEAINIVG